VRKRFGHVVGRLIRCNSSVSGPMPSHAATDEIVRQSDSMSDVFNIREVADKT